MEIIQIVGLGLVSTLLILLIKDQKPLFAFILSAFTGMVVFLFLVDKIEAVIRVLTDLANRSGVNQVFLKTILKIIGIAYIAEFGAQITRDAGQEGLAAKIELAGKVLIMVMAIPIITIIIETVMQLLPG
jgi:stage III sporulation protein AD